MKKPSKVRFRVPVAPAATTTVDVRVPKSVAEALSRVARLAGCTEGQVAAVMVASYVDAAAHAAQAKGLLVPVDAAARALDKLLRAPNAVDVIRRRQAQRARSEG